MQLSQQLQASSSRPRNRNLLSTSPQPEHGFPGTHACDCASLLRGWHQACAVPEMPLWLFIFLKPLIVGFTWIVDSYQLFLQLSSCLDLHGFANCRANWFARNHIHHLDSDRWQFELWEHSCTWATRCIAKLWPRVDLSYQRLLNLRATIFHKSKNSRT